MQDFEKLGVFYLGKEYDWQDRKLKPELLLYDSRDLTTHAVCVGMTGSGKTGLCLALLEEAAIDSIPAIIIDPKGDLGNLLLTFPELKPDDFKPWLDPADATRKGVSIDQLAEKTATTWREGLAEWGQDPARIARFRDAVDIAIYTPGSDAGLPLTVMRSFAAPSKAVLDNSDAMRERISAAVSGLLALVGIEADPLRSREHILLSNLLDKAWRAGQDVDLAGLVRQIQSPPLDKIGAVDLESFYPAKQRFELAMNLNNLLASPGFAGWMQGEPLDIQRLLWTDKGKPRQSIMSIAHLSDAERMFFVTILLNEMISWMRAQSGTSSLRALLYMDEVFGYFPPTANPPSKTPMLTLLKQARAFGVGVVLATQNPVDLDYKGLSNAGTWFLGRLQTERDKGRVLDGLQGASETAGAKFDRAKMEKILAGLGSRVFLMNNVHEDHPVVFQSRWALSFLRGPLSRDQIHELMQARKQAAAGSNADKPAGAATKPASTGAGGERPMLPPGVNEVFIPRRGNLPAGSTLLYRPGVLGRARVHFAQAASKIDVWQELTLLVPSVEDPSAGVWDEVEANTGDAPDLDKEPEASARFASLPAGLTQPKQYTALTTALKDHLYRTHRLELRTAKELKEISRPDESEGDFRIRLAHKLNELRDATMDDLRARYAQKHTVIQEKARKAQQKLDKEKSQASHQMWQALIEFGTSLVAAVCGRKLTSATNVSRAATSMRSAGRVMKEREEVGHAEENVEVLQKQMADLDAQCQEEIEKVRRDAQPENQQLETVQLQPKKSDISVTQVVLCWTPWYVNADGVAQPAS
jgi:hypothetical protein